MRKATTSVLVLLCICLSAGAAEYGRGALSADEGKREGLGHARLPRAEYKGFMPGGTGGIKLDLGWASVNWDIGPASGSEQLLVPQVSLFYKFLDNFDVNFSMLTLSAEDEDDTLGSTKADMTRLAVGIRGWINTRTRITPYVGGGAGYYLLDGATDKTLEDADVVPARISNMENVPGAFFEGGVAYEFTDSFFMNADVTYDFLLKSADVTINDEDEDFDVRTLCINLGVIWMF